MPSDLKKFSYEFKIKVELREFFEKKFYKIINRMLIFLQLSDDFST